MKKRIAILVFGIMFVSLASAGTIININPENFMIGEAYAGSWFSQEIEFTYPDIPENYENESFFVRININSDNKEYLIWKGDFELKMKIFQESLFGLFQNNEINMNCTQDNSLLLKLKNQTSLMYFVQPPSNGTFYCYNQEYRMMKKGSQNRMTLEIKPHKRIYPGNYSMEIEFLGMEEFPIVLNKKWNLISVPYPLWTGDIEEIFYDSKENIEGIWSYEDEEWKVYKPGVMKSLEDFVPGRGYWIKSNEDFQIIVIKEDFLNESREVNVSIYKGWNLVGHYGTKEKQAYCSFSSLNNDYIGFPKWSALLGYDSKKQRFTYLDYFNYTKPGEGYWIEVDEKEIYYEKECEN